MSGTPIQMPSGFINITAAAKAWEVGAAQIRRYLQRDADPKHEGPKLVPGAKLLRVGLVDVWGIPAKAKKPVLKMGRPFGSKNAGEKKGAKPKKAKKPAKVAKPKKAKAAKAKKPAKKAAA